MDKLFSLVLQLSTHLWLSVKKVEGHIDLHRLELSVNLTEEEGNSMVHQLAGFNDRNRAESPPGLEYWERDGGLGPEYNENMDL